RLTGDPPRVALVDDVVGAGLEGGQHHVVLGEALGHEHHTSPAELPRHGTGLGHRAHRAAEDVAHLGAGAVAVVGQHVDQYGDATRGVALVHDRLVGDPFELARAPLDGAVDGVVGNRRRLGLGHHGA